MIIEQMADITFASAMNRTSKSMLASKGLSRAGDHLTFTIGEIIIYHLCLDQDTHFTLLDKPPSCSHHLRHCQSDPGIEHDGTMMTIQI